MHGACGLELHARMTACRRSFTRAVPSSAVTARLPRAGQPGDCAWPAPPQSHTHPCACRRGGGGGALHLHATRAGVPGLSLPEHAPRPVWQGRGGGRLPQRRALQARPSRVVSTYLAQNGACAHALPCLCPAFWSGTGHDSQVWLSLPSPQAAPRQPAAEAGPADEGGALEVA